MKKNYAPPNFALVILEKEDILTHSLGGNETPDVPNPFMIIH